MKTRSTLLGLVLWMSLWCEATYAQEKEKPVFITMTTLHRSLDAKAKDWKAAEQEYFDKITSKNDLIIGSELLTHYYTNDNTEVVLVNVYRNWEDIEKANTISDDLAKKA
ncbi:hypothetical protein [Flavobacterium sp. 3-210]